MKQYPTLTVQELNQMSTEQRKAIQKRYPCAEQIILVDENDENRKLNPAISRADVNAYVRFGFKGSAPSLFHTTSFFIAKNKKQVEKWRPDFEQQLHPALLNGINQFRG
ncbi:hypothetical protein [Legionella cincinnatiensis]|uniref:hypothetical protein n=2 Tax=Legionella cincinnatiensis TaxID=28085 RepID=UPI001EE6EC7D|nr:hypothetical protein [Legionella cincinnatiensis]